jgi:hypothetical protein
MQIFYHSYQRQHLRTSKVACEHEFEAKAVCVFAVHADVSFVETLRSVLEHEALSAYMCICEPYTRPSHL